MRDKNSNLVSSLDWHHAQLAAEEQAQELQLRAEA
jgi:hypothetical protein